MKYTEKTAIATSPHLERWVSQSSMDFTGWYDTKVLETLPFLQGKGLQDWIDIYYREVFDFSTKQKSYHTLLCWYNTVRNDEGMREKKPQFLQLEGEQARKIIALRNDYEEALRDKKTFTDWKIPTRLKYLETLL